MNISENMPIELFVLLIFTMPGFFLIKIFSKKSRSGFEHSILSLFSGILLMTLYYYILPNDKFNILIQNPIAGAIIFSIITILFATVVKIIMGFLRKITNGIW